MDTLQGLDNEEKVNPLELDHSKAEKADTDELVDWVITNRVDPHQSVLKIRKDKLVTWNDLYRGIQSRKNYSGLANLFIPETLKSVETLLSLFHAGIFDSPTFVRFAGVDETDDISAGNLNTLNQYCMDENQFELSMVDFIRGLLINGTQVGKLLWDFKEKKYKRRNKKGQVEGKSETIRDVWTFQKVDMLHIVLPPTTPWNDIQSAEYVAEVKNVDKRFLKDSAMKNWISRSQLDKMLDEDLSEVEMTVDMLERQRVAASGIYESKTGPDHKTHSWIEYWGLLPAKFVMDKDDEYEDDDLIPSVCIIGDRDTVLKLDKIENIFWHNSLPYVASSFIPLEGEFFGMGVPEINQSLQEELNDTRNQIMDNKTLILANMWLVDKLSGIRADELRVKPFKVIKVNDLNGIKPLAPPVLMGAGISIESGIKEDMRQSVAAISGLQGIPQPGVGTATEFQGLQSSGMARIKINVKIIGETILKPVFRMAEALINQFYDHKMMVRVVGPNGVRHRFIKPEDVMGDYDVTLSLSTDFSKNPNVQNQQRLQLLQMLLPLPPQVIEQHWEMFEHVAENLGIKNFEQMYPAPKTAHSSVLLDPDEELQIIMNNQPVAVKPGQDHMGHIQAHAEQHNKYAHALPVLQADLLAAHTRDHMQYVQELMQLQSHMSVNPNVPPGPGQPPMQGSAPVPGQQPNSSPNTQMQPTTDNQMKQGIEGRPGG